MLNLCCLNVPKYKPGEIDNQGRIYVRTWLNDQVKPVSKGEIYIKARHGLRATRFGWEVEYPALIYDWDMLVIARK